MENVFISNPPVCSSDSMTFCSSRESLMGLTEDVHRYCSFERETLRNF